MESRLEQLEQLKQDTKFLIQELEKVRERIKRNLLKVLLILFERLGVNPRRFRLGRLLRHGKLCRISTIRYFDGKLSISQQDLASSISSVSLKGTPGEIDDLSQEILRSGILRLVVELDEKSRFIIHPGGRISAQQGHSDSFLEEVGKALGQEISIEVYCQKVTPSECTGNLFHGFEERMVDGQLLSRIISAEGLKPQARAIHMAPGLPEEEKVISGMRSSANHVAVVRAKAFLESGGELFLSGNGVYLSDQPIGPEFVTVMTIEEFRRP